MPSLLCGWSWGRLRRGQLPEGTVPSGLRGQEQVSGSRKPERARVCMHVCVHVSARVSLCVSGDTGAQGWGLLESPGCSRNPPASGQRPARLEHTATGPSVLRADPAPWPAPQGTRGGLGKGQGSRGAGLSGAFFLVLPGRAASGDAVAQAPSNTSAGTGPGLCLPRSPSMAGAVGRGLWRSGLWTRPREALDTGRSSGVRRHRRCWSPLAAPAPGTRTRPDQAPCPLARHAQRGGGSPRRGLSRARPCRKDGSAGWSPCPGGGRGQGLPQDLPLLFPSWEPPRAPGIRIPADLTGLG